jgi:hypothetical protein
MFADESASALGPPSSCCEAAADPFAPSAALVPALLFHCASEQPKDTGSVGTRRNRLIND